MVSKSFTTRGGAAGWARAERGILSSSERRFRHDLAGREVDHKSCLLLLAGRECVRRVDPNVTPARFTFQTAAIIPRRHAPEDLLFRFALEKRRGRRESRVPSSTRDRAHKVHTGDRKARRNTRPSLRNGFTAYGALSPA